MWLRNRAGPIAATAAGLIGILYFYRGFFFTRFTYVQGDPADGRLTSFLGTHWLDPFRWGSWQDTGMFYPLTETIGFSDWMFLNGMLSAPFAVLGIADEVAFQWSLIVLSLIGYASMVLLLRRGPGVGWPLSIVAGLVFVFGNNVYVASEHPQLAPVVLLPLLALLTLTAWRRASHRFWWALLPGLLLGLILVTAFYIFWYVLLASAVLGLVGFLYAPTRHQLRSHATRIGILVAGIVAGTLPFIAVTAPVYLAALDLGEGQRSTADILYWSLSPKDFGNVSTANAAWGWLIDLVYPEAQWWRAEPSEWAYAPSPLVWIGVFVSLALAIAGRHRLTLWAHVAVVGLLAGVVLELLLLRIGPFFPWAVVAELPGATAIRALGRLQLVATFLFIIGGAIIFHWWWQQREHRRLVHVAAAFVLVALVLEQVNLAPMQKNGPDRRDALQATPSPPAQCLTFVVIRPTSPVDLSPPTQIDAMLVSRSTGVKTMHGYTGIEPPGWNLTNSWEPDYRSRISDRISQFDAQEITCGLDLGSRTWLGPEELQAFLRSGT